MINERYNGWDEEDEIDLSPSLESIARDETSGDRIQDDRAQFDSDACNEAIARLIELGVW